MNEWTKEEMSPVLGSKDEISELHNKVKKSSFRQTFHIQPVAGLLNDPNGFIYNDGYWHLFYQWCPWGAFHGMKHWYHTVSKDLIHWKNAGLFLKPDTEYENQGAFSGTAYNEGDTVYLFYTGNHVEPDGERISYTCVAGFSNTKPFFKLDRPVFSMSPDYTFDQRDPKIIYNEDKKKYYILIGARTNDNRGTILIYESSRLLSGWKFAAELFVPGFHDFGGMWECPSMEHIGDKDILIFCPQYLKLPGRGSNTNQNVYIIGDMDWDTFTFKPDGGFDVLDFGFDSYAAQCAFGGQDTDSKILVAWMGLPDASYPTDNEGWSGCLTLARKLSVKGGRLIQTPLPEIRSLRGDMKEGSKGQLPKACEMEIMIPDLSSKKSESYRNEISFCFFTDKDGSGGIRFEYDTEKRMISVDRSLLGNRVNPGVGDVREYTLIEPLSKLSVFIDSSSIEVFVNDGEAVFTSRVFPTDEECYYIFPENASCRLWELRSSVVDDFVV